MKTSCILAGFSLLFSSAVASGRSARGANFRKAGVEDLLPPFPLVDLGPVEDSLLELSQEGKAAAQRRVLLTELVARERAAKQAKLSLETEQSSLVAVQKVQQLLEARLTKFEAREARNNVLESQVDSRIAAEKARARTREEQEQRAIASVEATHKLEESEEDRVSAQRRSDVRQAIKTQMVMIASGVPSASIIPGLISVASINVTQTEKQFWAEQNKAFVTNASGMVFYILSMLIAGYIYMECMDKSVGPKVPEHEVRVDEFQFGAFDCCSREDNDWRLCLCSWCFEWVRWADTASHPQVAFIAFWPALIMTAVLASASSITFGATIPILLLIVVLCRQRIRLAFGLPSGTCSVLAWDCCLWSFCPCCAIVQEARQVEYVESCFVKDSMASFGPAGQGFMADRLVFPEPWAKERASRQWSRDLKTMG